MSQKIKVYVKNIVKGVTAISLFVMILIYISGIIGLILIIWEILKFINQ